MADYTQSIDFSDKDALASGDANKVAKGADIDTELGLISTAIASKIDESREAQASGIATLDSSTLVPVAQLPAATAVAKGAVELATDAEAVTGTDATRAVTPDNLGQSGGVVSKSLSLADPGADRILFWDDSATGVEVAFLTVGTNLDLTGTTLSSPTATLEAALDHDNLVGFVADEHFAHSGISILAGSGLSGGGTIVANRTLTVDLTGLTQIEGNALAATDEFLVDDGGTNKAIRYQDGGLIVNAAISTVKTFTDAEMNQIWQLSGATDRQWDFDTGVGVAGNFIVLIQTSTGSIDLSAGTATINTAAGDFTRTTNSVVVGINVGSDVWYFYGDQATS